MRPTRNHYRKSTQNVKSNFALCVQQVFQKSPTSTRKPLLRLFYFALSMLMRNERTEFEREVLLADGRKKQMTSEYVSFKRLLGMIRRTLEDSDCHFNQTNSQQTP
jgi:hypothetical protein